MAYSWKRYEKIVLMGASLLGWFPVAWAGFFLSVYGYVWISSNFPFMAFLFSYDLPEGFPLIKLLLSGYILVFGLLPYFFPKIFFLPTWICNLIFLILGLRKIMVFLLFSDDLSVIFLVQNLTNFDYVIVSDKVGYQGFSAQDIYLAFLEFFFLIILFRPARHYARGLWHRIRHFRIVT